MLATLARGIKGGKWYSLIDKVWKMENLQSAVGNVVRKQEQAQARRPTLLALCRASGLAAASLAGQTPKRGISTAARAQGLDTQAGQQGTQAAGHPAGGKSSRRNGRAPSHRTDI